MVIGFTGMEKSEATLPTKVAIACSNCARAIPTLVAPASALAKVVWASTTDNWRVDAKLIQRLREFQLLLVGGNRLVENLLQHILPADFEIELRQAGLLGQALILQISRAYFRGILRLTNGISNLAPRSGAHEASRGREKTDEVRPGLAVEVPFPRLPEDRDRLAEGTVVRVGKY